MLLQRQQLPSLCRRRQTVLRLGYQNKVLRLGNIRQRRPPRPRNERDQRRAHSRYARERGGVARGIGG